MPKSALYPRGYWALFTYMTEKSLKRRNMTEKSKIAKPIDREVSKTQEGTHMANLQDLLGESFKEEMTVEEIQSALAGLNLIKVDPERPLIEKSKFDLLASEVAEHKKRAKELEKASLTEEQKREAEMAELMEKLNRMQKDTMKSETKSKLLSVGIENDKLVDELAESFADSDSLSSFIETLTGVITERDKETVKKTKQDSMKNAPTPPAGEPPKEKTLHEMNYTELALLKASDPAKYQALTAQGE